MKHGFMIMWLLCFLLPITAQNNPDETLVFVKDNEIAVLQLFGSGATTLAEDYPSNRLNVMNPMSSPDGELIYFVDDSMLWRVPIVGDGDPVMVSDLDIMDWLPIAFSPDGSQLLIPIQAPNRMIELWVGDLDGRNMQQLVSIPENVGCGTDGVTSDVLAYWYQTGVFGNQSLLSWISDTQVLMNTNCFGFGILSVDLATGEFVSLDEQIVRSKINPSNTMLAGLVEENTTIRLINLSDGEAQEFDFGHNFDQLAWLEDGRFVISAISHCSPITFTPIDEQIALDLGIWFDNDIYGTHKPNSLPLYQTTLYIFDPATGDLTELWTEEGLNGLPVIVIENDNIFFSAINDFEDVANALNNGQDRATIEALYPSSSIYVTRLDSDAPVLLVEGGTSPLFIDN